jgi:N-acetylmuramoyl-L-alanine amidase
MGSRPVNKTMIRRMFRQFAPCGAGAALQGMHSVGLIVFMGFFSFIVSPDDNFAPIQHGIVAQTAAGAKLGGPISEPSFQQVLPGNGPPTVVIDPGHGGIDDGTKYFGLAEKDCTLDVGERLDRYLKSLHIQTVMTRTENVYVSLPRRAEIANQVADQNSNSIYVSIHFNQSAVEYVDGIETYYADKKIPPPDDWTWVGFFQHPEDDDLDRGQNLAADIQSSLVRQMMLPNRGIKSRSLFVTRHTRMPAVLVEGGFLSNKIENQSLRNDSYRERIAEGIGAGILTYIQNMHSTIPMRMVTAVK